MKAPSRVLAVDLDGTLIAGDMLHASFWATLGRDRGAVLKAGAKFITGGRAALKQSLAAGATVDVAHLPYKNVVLDEIRSAKEQGAHVVLATASDRSFAQAVADHLGLFDEVMASDGSVNLKGEAKTAALVDRFGAAGFSYLGDSAADLPVWAASREAISVDAPAALKGRIKAPEVRHLEGAAREGQGFGPFLKALRPHQWLKNLLIFIPMLLAHDFSGSTILAALAAFVSFCLVASSVYVLNDLVDLSADRAHPRKCLRPFASGALPLSVGLWLAPGLLIAGAVVGAFAGPLFLLVLLFYYLCTLAYSLGLKRITVIDICMLAGLYTLRVIAGAAATMTAPSVWLLGFSIFFFLALAAVKRQAELVDLVARGDEKAEGRGYLPDDLPLITMMALASGYVSVLVAGLYLTSDAVAELYSFPSALWGICAVLIYWVSRIVMLTHRRRMHDDPIVFAVTDKVSLFCAVVIVGLVVFAAQYSIGAG
ncbi:MAG: UbiA family prenyltransferase [Boseongicola sp.]|nr:UbiA family prenyltransferase [Boseongicola sp.]